MATYDDRFAGESNWDVVYAERRIFADYGDLVSVEEKLKVLSKFGRSLIVGTSPTTVAGLGTEANETYLSSDATHYISSSSTSDTSQTLTIEYHTVTGSGTSQQFTFGTQTKALNGQTEVALDTACARVSRMYVSSGSTDLVGTVYCYSTSGNSSGVPTTASSVRCTIPAGENQSFKAATTFSDTDYFIMTGGWVSVNDKTAATATCSLQVRPPGGVFRTQFTVTVSNGGPTAFVPVVPFFVVPKNYDVRVTAVADGANTDVDASFSGYLAKVVTGTPIEA